MPSPEAAAAADLARWDTTAMASMVALSVPGPRDRYDVTARRALDVFAHVEQVCSRFGSTSALVRCNARPRAWHRAPRTLVKAVAEARRAYRETGGAFDPRVHDRLVELGYRESFGRGPTAGPGEDRPVPEPAAAMGPWRPRAAARLGLLNLGGVRIDLGGIGKGLALRWAAEVVREATGNFLIEAGGDVVTSGSPGGGGWRIGVERPDGGQGPLAVLEVSGLAVATSSVRIRQWRAGGTTVHHLIDPRTGQPGGRGLLSVTVVGPDPAGAEVWSKGLFLAGADGIAGLASERGLAALWVEHGGVMSTSPAMDPYLLWVAP